MDLNKEELTLILDGLSQLPLAKSYYLFQKILQELNKPEVPSPTVIEGE